MEADFLITPTLNDSTSWYSTKIIAKSLKCDSDIINLTCFSVRSVGKLLLSVVTVKVSKILIVSYGYSTTADRTLNSFNLMELMSWL